MIAWDPTSGLAGIGWVIVIGGVFFDLGSYAVWAYMHVARRVDASRV